jgi:23S rRNA (cytidine1920-2'-O)/16S rRNA (cytidine1409-2'-O)-methyltransferase
MEGRVFVDGVRASKAGQRTRDSSEIVVKPGFPDFASRGGIKLAAALREFGIEVKGKTVLDCGASTGGFTDCLLRAGAARVYAVDVGYGLLAWELRLDPRVIVLERTNLRYLTPETLGARVDMATLDVSFISLTKVWPSVRSLVVPGGEVLSLVKPQFEAGRRLVGKKGVVRDPSVHYDVLVSLCDEAMKMGFAVAATCFSPITGAEGNVEFWIYMLNGSDPSRALDRGGILVSARSAVNGAHDALGPDGRGRAATEGKRLVSENPIPGGTTDRDGNT